jgi:hypothetical protein
LPIAWPDDAWRDALRTKQKSPPIGGLFVLLHDRPARGPVLLGNYRRRHRLLGPRQQQDDHCADEGDRSQGEERGFRRIGRSADAADEIGAEVPAKVIDRIDPGYSAAAAARTTPQYTGTQIRQSTPRRI